MKRKRIAAIDIMRGLSLLGMMLVNLNPDEALSFRTLVHTEWFGITLADCFFPCFLFLSGVSAGIHAEKKLLGQDSLRKALKRGLGLILLGMLYNHFSCFWALLFNSDYGMQTFLYETTQLFRPFGVLQRIGFAYIFGTLIFRLTKTKRNVMIAAFAILFVTTAGFFLYRPADPFSETDNISIFVDQMLQGSSHNYLQKVFDPEGLYGNLTACASILFGMVAGVQLKEKAHMESVCFGSGLALLGWLVSAVVIVSKPLWTAPYVLILSGAFMILLPALDYLIGCSPTAEKWLALPKLLGAHSMLTYLCSGLLESFLNAVKVGDSNLYHFLWQHTVYSDRFTAASCLLASLFPVCLVCVIVYAAVKVQERRSSNA